MVDVLSVDTISETCENRVNKPLDTTVDCLSAAAVRAGPHPYLSEARTFHPPAFPAAERPHR